MSHKEQIISGKVFTKNTIYNLLGQGLPMFVGLVTIPMMIKGMGLERFGLLSISWMVVGYFSLFDLGLGRALTKIISEKLGQNKKSEIPSVYCSSLFLMVLISLVGSLILALFADPITRTLLKVTPDLYQESYQTFLLLALGIPLVTLNSGLRGLLEAYQKFSSANILQVFVGSGTFLAPVIVLIWTPNLALIVASLLLVRFLSCVCLFAYSVRLIENFQFKIDTKLFKGLLQYGGWITVANSVGPLMVYFDRFVVSFIKGVSVISYYTTPYEMITRLWIVPGAISRFLLPAFATYNGEKKELAFMFDRGLRATYFLLYPVCFLVFCFSHELMQLWLGSEFANQSAPLLQLLTIGVLLNSLTWTAYTYLQSTDYVDIAAKIQMVELPIYFAVAYYMTTRWGLQGAACAWSLRLIIDMFTFLYFSQKHNDFITNSLKNMATLFTVTLALLIGSHLVPSLAARIAYFLVANLIFALWIYKKHLLDTEKNFIKRLLSQRRQNG